MILFTAPFFINQFIYLFICIYSFIYSYVHLYAHVMHSWHSCVHQRIFLTTWNRFGAHKPTWFLAPFVMHIFCQSQSYLMLPDYKYAFFVTNVALCLLLYICHLGPCFGSGHCGPFGNPTLVDFIWAVGSPSGSLGFFYEMECPVRAVGHWVTCPLWYWFVSL